MPEPTGVVCSLSHTTDELNRNYSLDNTRIIAIIHPIEKELNSVSTPPSALGLYACAAQVPPNAHLGRSLVVSVGPLRGILGHRNIVGGSG
jgi:hypothetical protein